MGGASFDWLFVGLVRYLRKLRSMRGSIVGRHDGGSGVVGSGEVEGIVLYHGCVWMG